MDDEVWNRVKNGDQAALGLIYERYADIMYAYGMKIAQDSELVADAIQDLFLYLYEKRKTISIPANAKAYLLLSLKRQIYQAKTNESKANSHILRLDSDDGPNFHLELDIQATREISDFTEEQLTALQEALNELTPRQSEIMYLRYYKQLSLDEVVEVLGTSKQTVKNLLCTSIAKLRENELLKKSLLLEILVVFERFFMV